MCSKLDPVYNSAYTFELVCQSTAFSFAYNHASEEGEKKK